MKPASIKAQMTFANTKSFWLTMFEAFYHSAVELIDAVRKLIVHVIIYKGSTEQCRIGKVSSE
jgi:hypothetical protein